MESISKDLIFGGILDDVVDAAHRRRDGHQRADDVESAQPEAVGGRGPVQPDPALYGEKHGGGPEPNGAHQANNVAEKRNQDAQKRDDDNPQSPAADPERDALRECSGGVAGSIHTATCRQRDWYRHASP